MKTKTFGEGITKFQVGNNLDYDIVAVWNKDKPGDSAHLSPAEALEMAKALTKGAIEVLKAGGTA